MCLIMDSNINTISMDKRFCVSNTVLDANLEQNM